MAYSKRYAGGFVDLPTQTSAVDSTFLNAVEAALLKLFDTDPTVDGQLMSWIAASTKFGPALLFNKNVDPAAAIVKSKLDLTGANGIVNADVKAAAGIDITKLANLADATKVLRADGTWGQVADAQIAAGAAISPSKIAATYSAYTPTWTASGVAPSFGNANVIARYAQIGKFVHAFGLIQFGTTSTFGTGTYNFAIPVTLNASNTVNMGTFMLSQNTTGALIISSATSAAVGAVRSQHTATYAGASVVTGQLTPWTWATNDYFSWDITYEAA